MKHAILIDTENIAIALNEVEELDTSCEIVMFVSQN